MLNIEEIVIYLIIIVGIICMIHMYNKMNQTVYPILEGLTNSDTKSTTNKPAVNGLNAGSVEYNQDILGLISVSEIELNTSKYSNEYVEILKNLKALYTKKILKNLLQINTADPTAMPRGNDGNLIPAYKTLIETIDTVLTNLSTTQQTIPTKFNTPTFNSGNNEGDAEGDTGGDESGSSSSSSWSPW